MTDIMERETELLITYTDPEEGFKGYLAIDSLTHRIAAGGFRVQKGLTARHVTRLARNMTLKQRITGLRVDGAKSGIDYDPASPGKEEAIRRFLRAIRPYILERYSMGPDLNVKLKELDSITKGLSIPSVKMAIASAQGIEMPEFLRRYRLLNEGIDGMTLGQVRAGYGVAAAVLVVLKSIGIPPNEARITIQGFGSVGSSTALSLHRSGVSIVAISDEEKCLLCQTGLDIDSLLSQRQKEMLPTHASVFWKEVPQDEIYHVQADVIVSAAIENAIDERQATSLPVKAVVTGANLGVSVEAEKVLYQRSILVVPDFVAGCGGSLSMDGLFGPKEIPTPMDVLNHIENRIRQIVQQIIRLSKVEEKIPREVALAICAEATEYPDALPYGRLEDVLSTNAGKKGKPYV